MKRAALYLRVSTLDQHPETQLHDLRQMAAQRGFEIVNEFTDRISGTKSRRPGLDELMTGARRGRFDVVLVWASDRIARSVKHFLEVLDELNRKRTASPSGESAAFGLNIALWFRHRKWFPSVEFAGGDRFQRSGRLFS